MTHKCPGPDCEKEIPRVQLACPRHWYQVPKPLRDEVWREYRAAPLSQKHRAALDAAIKEMKP